MRMRVLRDVIATPTNQTTQVYAAGWTGTAPRGIIAQLVAGGAAVVVDAEPELEPAGVDGPPAEAASPDATDPLSGEAATIPAPAEAP